MSKSNKTSQVLKMLNISEKSASLTEAKKDSDLTKDTVLAKNPALPKESTAAKNPFLPNALPKTNASLLNTQELFIDHIAEASPNQVNIKQTDTQEPPSEKPANIRRRPRKTVVKSMKFNKLASVKENPAIKAPSDEEHLHMRPAGERQIVNIPLLLINEQLGTAVERFKVCACDECLLTITQMALRALPPMFIRAVNTADDEKINALIKELRPEVIRTLARICISAPGKSYHYEE